MSATINEKGPSLAEALNSPHSPLPMSGTTIGGNGGKQTKDPNWNFNTHSFPLRLLFSICERYISGIRFEYESSNFIDFGNYHDSRSNQVITLDADNGEYITKIEVTSHHFVIDLTFFTSLDNKHAVRSQRSGKDVEGVTKNLLVFPPGNALIYCIGNSGSWIDSITPVYHPVIYSSNRFRPNTHGWSLVTAQSEPSNVSEMVGNTGTICIGLQPHFYVGNTVSQVKIYTYYCTVIRIDVCFRTGFVATAGTIPVDLDDHYYQEKTIDLVKNSSFGGFCVNFNRNGMISSIIEKTTTSKSFGPELLVEREKFAGFVVQVCNDEKNKGICGLQVLQY